MSTIPMHKAAATPHHLHHYHHIQHPTSRHIYIHKSLQQLEASRSQTLSPRTIILRKFFTLRLMRAVSDGREPAVSKLGVDHQKFSALPRRWQKGTPLLKQLLTTFHHIFSFTNALTIALHTLCIWSLTKCSDSY